ncbi:MAG TPA: alpha/beta hydrolase [Bryobacteraceae bacterium]|jgi:acetyl esterase/lipase|nr:alpha/beta hydrolase [Bryobacteraceae bacterium]
MSQQAQRHEMTTKPVVYRLAEMDAVKVRRDVVYQTTEAGVLTMDLYYPPDPKSQAAPAVIIVAGYPDGGFERMLGCKFKEMASSVSWGQLAAASGIVAVTYANREPVTDLARLLEYLRQNAGDLGIDPSRIALWASSGNVPLALATLMQPEARDYVKCGVLCYGLTLDLDGGTGVAEAARMFGFANPCAGKTVRDLPQDLPLFVARAGQDAPQLNEALDRFLSQAIACNLPITFANHPTGPHAFDLMQDSETSHEIIRQVLAFLKFHLREH